MTQDQDLQFLRCIATSQQQQPADHPTEDQYIKRSATTVKDARPHSHPDNLITPQFTTSRPSIETFQGGETAVASIPCRRPTVEPALAI